MTSTTILTDSSKMHISSWLVSVAIAAMSIAMLAAGMIKYKTPSGQGSRGDSIEDRIDVLQSTVEDLEKRLVEHEKRS